MKNTSDMRRGLLVLSGLLLSVFLSAQPLKVGLVLGGGGAKGAATIQILKALDEAGVPVDCVVGTSIGALIGGLYAYGYTPEEIEKIYNDTEASSILNWVVDGKLSDWEWFQYLKSLFGSNRGDQALAMLKSKVGAGTTFRDTRIPFRCVATDMDKGMMPVVLGTDPDDNLALALRASMSVPLAFNRVSWKGKHLLSDGGLINNLPVDVARAMGAEIVIAIDLEQEGESFLSRIPARALKRVVDWTQWLTEGITSDDFLCESEMLLDWLDTKPDTVLYNRNRADADYYINPNLHGYNMASFREKDKKAMKGRGVDAIEAYPHWEGIRRLALKREGPNLDALRELILTCGEGLSQPFRMAGSSPARNRAREAGYPVFMASAFQTPEEGRDEAARWLGYYLARGEKDRARDCATVLNAFLDMAWFFDGYFPSPRSFESQKQFMGTHFSVSPFPVVRNSWTAISASR